MSAKIDIGHAGLIHSFKWFRQKDLLEKNRGPRRISPA
jgi:hypothetical protein